MDCLSQKCFCCTFSDADEDDVSLCRSQSLNIKKHSSFPTLMSVLDRFLTSLRLDSEGSPGLWSFWTSLFQRSIPSDVRRSCLSWKKSQSRISHENPFSVSGSSVLPRTRRHPPTSSMKEKLEHKYSLRLPDWAGIHKRKIFTCWQKDSIIQMRIFLLDGGSLAFLSKSSIIPKPNRE